MTTDAQWRSDLEDWLEPFLVGLSHPARRKMCPLYVAGLIGPGDRKSVQPMAARTGEVGHDRLHHFVSAGWSCPRVWPSGYETFRASAACRAKALGVKWPKAE